MAEITNGKSESYRGPSGIARESPWLTAEDLPEGRDVTVEIEDVLKRTGIVFQGGRKKPLMLALKFKGKERELGLNATNRKRLNNLFGYDTGNWLGKKIALYVDVNVQMAGETVRAVRIRPLEPKTGAAATVDRGEPFDEPAR